MNLVDLCSVLGLVVECKIGKTVCSLNVKLKNKITKIQTNAAIIDPFHFSL